MHMRCSLQLGPRLSRDGTDLLFRILLMREVLLCLGILSATLVSGRAGMGARVEVDLAVRYVRLLLAAGDLLEPGFRRLARRSLSRSCQVTLTCRSAAGRPPIGGRGTSPLIRGRSNIL